MDTGVVAEGVSVIVRSHLGARRLRRCLGSLVAQRLAPDRFEIVVVVNGPDDGAADLVSGFRRRHHRHEVRLVHTPRANGPHASNVGLAAARREYVTFVDDDDWVSPEFLSALMERAAPGIIAHAALADVEPGRTFVHDFDTYVNRSVMRWSGAEVAVREAASALQFNTAKVVRTEVARSVRWDEDLRSVGDTLYWHELAAAHPLRLSIVPSERHAVYFRLRRPDSLSRPADADPRYLADLTRVCDRFDAWTGPDASGAIALARAWSRRRRAEILTPASEALAARGR